MIFPDCSNQHIKSSVPRGSAAQSNCFIHNFEATDLMLNMFLKTVESEAFMTKSEEVYSCLLFLPIMF